MAFSRTKPSAQRQTIIKLTDDLGVAEIANKIVVPEGGQMFVAKIRGFNPACAWEPMLRESCPDYQSPDILRVGELYPPEVGDPKDHYIFGVNFGRNIPDAQVVVDWGKANSLPEATPRHVYAVATRCPTSTRRSACGGCISSHRNSSLSGAAAASATPTSVARGAAPACVGSATGGATAVGSPSTASALSPERTWPRTLRPFDLVRFCGRAGYPLEAGSCICMLRSKMDSRPIFRRSRLPEAEFWNGVYPNCDEDSFSQEHHVASLKKEDTRCALLADFRSQIRYSPEKFYGQWHRWHRTRTFEGNRRVCNANFNDAKRNANLNWFGYGWRDNDWFTFYRNSLPFPAHSRI